MKNKSADRRQLRHLAYLHLSRILCQSSAGGRGKDILSEGISDNRYHPAKKHSVRNLSEIRA